VQIFAPVPQEKFLKKGWSELISQWEADEDWWCCKVANPFGSQVSLNCGNRQLVYTFCALDSCLKDRARSPTTTSSLCTDSHYTQEDQSRMCLLHSIPGRHKYVTSTYRSRLLVGVYCVLLCTDSHYWVGFYFGKWDLVPGNLD
jgi:hypothetical protein